METVLTDATIFEEALRRCEYLKEKNSKLSVLFVREGLAAKRVLTRRLYDSMRNPNDLKQILDEWSKSSSASIVMGKVEWGEHRELKRECDMPVRSAYPYETYEGGTASVTKVAVHGHGGELFARKSIKSNIASSLWLRELYILKSVNFVHLTRLLATFTEPGGVHIVLHPWCTVRQVLSRRS
jgi:hypothetical protein